MKKRGLWSIGIVALAVFVMAACGNGTTETAGDTDEPLVYSDIVNGKVVEITISRTDPSRAVLTPKVGDYFEIKYNGVVISKGRITKFENGGRATFTPATDSPGPKQEFTGTFTEEGLSLPSIPIADGASLTDVDATEDGGTSPTSPTSSGGGGGGGSGNGGGNNGGTGGTQPTAPTAPGGDAPELSAALDALLSKYTGPQQQAWDGEAVAYGYWLDPARFEEFKAALDTAGEYAQDGDGWTGPDDDRGAHHLGLTYALWQESPDGKFGLSLFKEDNTIEGYKYKEVPGTSGTKTDELLREYMAPEPIYWPATGIEYHYYLDPARFDAFKAELATIGEYFQFYSRTEESRDGDKGLTFARWFMRSDGGVGLHLLKADNSTDMYGYAKIPPVGTGIPVEDFLSEYMGPKQQTRDDGLTYNSYYLDSARFEEFKAALDTGSEYSRAPSWADECQDEDPERDLTYADWHIKPNGSGFRLRLQEEGTIVGYEYTKDPQASGARVDELLLKYMAPIPQHLNGNPDIPGAFDPVGIYYRYCLDPDRYEAFRAELEATGEYVRIGDFEDLPRTWNLGLYYALWFVRPDGVYELELSRSDNSRHKYAYEKNDQWSGTEPEVDELLRKYMMPMPQNWPNEGVAHGYGLDPARFEDFRAELEATGEYYRAPDMTGNRDHDLGLNFLEWVVGSNGVYELILGKVDNSIVGYRYEKDPQSSGTTVEGLLREYMGPKQEMWSYEPPETGERLMYVYHLDPARFEEFRARLVATGEYYQIGSKSGPVDWGTGEIFAQWCVNPADGSSLLRHHKADNTAVLYDYVKVPR